VFVKDRGGKYLLFNEAAARFVGKAVAEVLGRDDTELFDPAGAERVMDRDRRVMTSGRAETDEETLTAAGTTRTYLATKAPYRDATGTVIGLVGISRDITERKRAEEALVLFRALIDRTADVIEVVDPATGRFLDVNEAACLAHGYTREEYLSLRVCDVDPLVAARSWEEVLEGQRRSGFQPFESLHRRKDGSVFPVEVNVTHIRLDREYMVAVVRDITERKRMGDALRNSEEMLRRAQALAQVGSWTYCAEGGVFVGSDEANRLCGWGPGPHRLDELVSLLPPEDAPAFAAQWRAALAGAPFETEHRLIVAGRIRWVHVRVEPETDPTGRVVRVVGVTQDVTERRSLEDQLRHAQKMEALGRLAGGVAHDFNNLLTVISGYVGLVLNQLPPNDRSRGSLGEAQRAAERAANLTRQLLAFSRKQMIQSRVTDLNALVGELGKLLKRLIGSDVKLDVVLDPALDRVKVDPGQFEQVLMNLAVNARDAMPTGGALVVETRNVELDPAACASRPGVRAGRYVRLAVRDTGHGMDEATRTRIFEPFFTTKEAGKGTGLGLAVVDSVVRQSGGHVEVHTEVGRGTTFYIYVPAVPEACEAPGKPPSRLHNVCGTETVLLVDDSTEVRALVSQVLRSVGYTVLEAGDGVEALHVGRAHEGVINLLLTDMVMPRMSGPQLAETMVAACPGLKVLYLSADVESVPPHPGVPGERAGYLQKPFTPAALARGVRAALDV
jgi:PAS domain S-box-containing protein